MSESLPKTSISILPSNAWLFIAANEKGLYAAWIFEKLPLSLYSAAH
jgi:hypothetical protein